MKFVAKPRAQCETPTPTKIKNRKLEAISCKTTSSTNQAIHRARVVVPHTFRVYLSLTLSRLRRPCLFGNQFDLTIAKHNRLNPFIAIRKLVEPPSARDKTENSHLLPIQHTRRPIFFFLPHYTLLNYTIKCAVPTPFENDTSSIIIAHCSIVFVLCWRPRPLQLDRLCGAHLPESLSSSLSPSLNLSFFLYRKRDE